MHFFYQIDTLLARFFGNIVDRLCTATGKTNYFWAKAALLAGLVVSTGPFSMGRVPLNLAIFGLFFVLRPWRLIKRLEQRGEPGDAIPLEIRRLELTRWMDALMGVVFYALGDHYFGLALVLVAMGQYFAARYNPGGKSWARRAVEWMKSIKLPSLAPNPALGGV
jgi:hypothetical protein